MLARFGTLVALVATATLGILSDGARELLAVHIPLALAAMSLGARLAGLVVVRQGLTSDG